MADWTPPESDLVKVKDEFLKGLARLETAGGKKTIKGPNGEDSNNLFNIKDNTGQGYRARDKAEGSNDAYRVYASTDQSKDDLTNLLARKYPNAISAQTPEEFANALKGYATDPLHGKKLVAAIKSGASKMWSPPDADKMEESSWSPPAGDAMDAKPKEEPGWFQPGSASSALVSGLAKGATWGMGDEITAKIRSVTGGDTYDNELKDIRGRNATDAKEHPVISTVSNIVSSIPSYLAGGGGKLAAQMAKTGIVSGIQAAGASEGDLGDRAKDAAIGAGIGALAPAAGKAVSNSLSKVASVRPDGSLVANVINYPGTTIKDLAAKVLPTAGGQPDRLLGAAAGYHTGGEFSGDSTTGKLLGGAYGYQQGLSGLASKFQGRNKAAVGTIDKLISKPVNLGVSVPGAPSGMSAAAKAAFNQETIAGANAATDYTTRAALIEMSKPQAKVIVNKGNQQIEQAVASGQPEYAARFTQMNNPAYRQATKVEDDGSIDPDDKEEDDDEE